MRRKFSEKFGFSKPNIKIQKEQIDDRLHNRIWNTIVETIFNKIRSSDVGSLYTNIQIRNGEDYGIFVKLYDEVYAEKGRPSRNPKELYSDLHSKYLKFEWFEVYNFLEDLVYYHHDLYIIKNFKKAINLVLEKELSAYRFVDDCIAPIIEDIEIKEIETVFDSKYNSVKGHMAKALEHLSDRDNPDYQNSIKESISAVESIVNTLIGKTNIALNKGLNTLPFEIDNNFKQGMIRLYSWTSSSDGIRHGAHDGEILSGFNEAKYMLVSCSAFINYLILKHETKE